MNDDSCGTRSFSSSTAIPETPTGLTITPMASPDIGHATGLPNSEPPMNTIVSGRIGDGVGNIVNGHRHQSSNGPVSNGPISNGPNHVGNGVTSPDDVEMNDAAQEAATGVTQNPSDSSSHVACPPKWVIHDPGMKYAYEELVLKRGDNGAFLRWLESQVE